MATSQDPVVVYCQLAEAHHRLNHPQERDRFMVLAADAALATGRPEQAEDLRRALLHRNPNHLLRPYRSLSDAMQSHDLRAYVIQLRRNYPVEKAQTLLEQLGDVPAETGGEDDEFVIPLDVDRPTAVTGLGQSSSSSVAASSPVHEEESVDKEPAASAPVSKSPSWRSSAVSEPPPLPMPGSDDPSPGVFRLPPAPRGSRSSAGKDEDEETGPESWVGTFLFLLVLAAAVAILIFTFVIPLMPSW